MDNFVFGYSDGLEAVFAVVIVCRATSSRLPNASPTQEVQRNDADDLAPPRVLTPKAIIKIATASLIKQDHLTP